MSSTSLRRSLTDRGRVSIQSSVFERSSPYALDIIFDGRRNAYWVQFTRAYSTNVHDSVIVISPPSRDVCHGYSVSSSAFVQSSLIVRVRSERRLCNGHKEIRSQSCNHSHKGRASKCCDELKGRVEKQRAARAGRAVRHVLPIEARHVRT